MTQRLGPISFDPALLAQRLAIWRGLDEATLFTQLKGGAENVDEFVREVLGPIRRKYRKLLGGKAELKV